MEISSLWRRFRPCSKRQYFPLLESSVDCRIYPNLPYLCISYSPWQYWSTYYIPLPQQLASFAWYFHVVEGISQSQTLEYRFGRYLPVLFAHAHKILQSCLTVYQIYSDNFSSIILHSNDFYANIHQLFWNNQFFSEIYHISMRCPRLLHNHYVYVRLFHSAIFHFHAFFIILLALAGSVSVMRTTAVRDKERAMLWSKASMCWGRKHHENTSSHHHLMRVTGVNHKACLLRQ